MTLTTPVPKAGSTRSAIGDDRDLAVGQGQVDVLADQVFVARVFGVHGHGGVAQHGLGPGGGDVEDFAGRSSRRSGT